MIIHSSGLLLPAAACTIGLLSPLRAASAQETPAAACAALESDASRLTCYDEAFGRANITAPSTRPEAQAPPFSTTAANQRHDDPYAVESRNTDLGRKSLLDGRWELAGNSKLGVFNMRAYKPLYLLPAFWTSKPNLLPHSPNPNNTVASAQELNTTEVKLQLSFKTKAIERLFGGSGDIWMGYTQTSHWQAYNVPQSRPFRETNYEPEVMAVFPAQYTLLGWNGRLASIGVNHQSNGRSDPFSRSWNRIILGIGLDRPNWSIMFRPWYRLPESRTDDNNPDIEDYIGRGDITVVHTIGDHRISLMGRHSLHRGKRAHGALQLDWGFPLSNQLRGHLQLFDGYGESMIDYNHRALYLGLGISLLEWH